MTIVVAVVGGTIISVIFGYLVAYWRDLLNNPRRMGQGPEWLKSFERFVRVKQGEIRQQDSSVRSQMNGMGTGLGRGSVKPDLLGVGLKELEEFYQKNHGQAEAQFFAQLSLGRAQLDEAAAERSKQFKQKWGQAISSDFFKERLIELVIEQVFIQNKAQGQGQGLNLKAIYELWESYSALTLWYDDIRAKRASLAQDIVKRLALAPQAALRGLDFFFLAKSGQSKDSLKKQYWQEQLKGQDHMGRRLTQMSPERRKQLLLSLAFPARYKVKTYPELLNDACSLIAELEQFFEQAQAQENGQKKAPPKSGKTTGPKDDFSILEMEPTDDMATIKKAFRKMAMKYHPDRLNLQKEDDQKRAHERYVELQKAYERLEARVGKKAA